jgi:hypothetical protein
MSCKKILPDKFNPLHYADEALHKTMGSAWEAVEDFGEDAWDAVKPVAGVIAGAALIYFSGGMATPFAEAVMAGTGWGMALGSGITTGVGLAQGQKWEDLGDASLRAGLIGGAAGGVGAGVGRWAGSTFGSTVQSGLAGLPMGGITVTPATAGSIAGGIVGAGAGALTGMAVGTIAPGEGTVLSDALAGAGAGAAGGWATGGAGVKTVTQQNIARYGKPTGTETGNFNNAISGKYGMSNPDVTSAINGGEGMGGFQTVRTGTNVGPRLPGTAEFSAVPSSTFVPTTAQEAAFMQTTEMKYLQAALNPFNDPSALAAKGAMAMLSAGAPMTHENLLTVGGLAEPGKVATDNSVVAPSKKTVTQEPEVASTTMSWDRTMGTLFGGTELIGSTTPVPTARKTKAGVSDALLGQTGALMV